jgi:serine/threonine-protein kinase
VKGEIAAVGPRSDVYALGAILFEILALEPLHQGSTTEALVASTLLPKEARPGARRKGIPPELDAICVRAAAWDPAQRFPSAKELHEALERCLDGERDAERRRVLAREHVLAAERAFETAAEGGADAEAERVVGMRELGAALALEPTNEDASRTLVRVLLQGSKDLPPAAEAALREVDIRDRVRGAKIGMLFYAATFLPGMFLVTPHIRRPLLGLVLLVVSSATVASLGWMWRTGKADPRYMRNAVVLSFVLCGIQSALFGPFVLAPGAAAATAAIFLVNIRASPSTRRAILWMALASVFVPAALELLNILPRHYAVENGRLVILSDLFTFEPVGSIVLLAFGGALTVAATVVGVGRAVETLVEAERANFAQAFRLRQILDPRPR